MSRTLKSVQMPVICAVISEIICASTRRTSKILMVLLCLWGIQPGIHAMPHADSSRISGNLPQYTSAIAIQDDRYTDRASQESSNIPAYKNFSVTHQGQASELNIKTHLALNYLDAPQQHVEDDQLMRISEFYLDASSRGGRLNSRLGRQSFQLAGDAYALDGFSLDYQLANHKRLKFLAGYARAGADEEQVNTDTALYGLGVESGRFFNNWQADLYAFEERLSTEAKHQYYGSRLSYIKPGHKASLRITMAPFVQEAQSSQFNYQWTRAPSQAMNLALDYRKPGAYAAGQALPALDALLKSMSEQQLEALGQDQEAAFRSAALSWSRALHPNLHLTSKFSVSSLSPSILDDTYALGTYHLYGIHLQGKRLLRRNDMSSLKLEYAEYESMQRWSLFWNTQTPLVGLWHADVQLEAYLEAQNNHSRFISLGPLFKLQYKQNKHIRYDLEFGMKRTENLGPFNQIEEHEDMFFKLRHSRSL